MSVDDLLWALTDVDSITGKVRISKEAARAIGEALKAGQAMRDAIEVSPPNTTGYAANIDKPLGTAHGYDAGSAALAWDAASKEEV